MKHLQTFEAYIDDDGNLVQSKIDTEGNLDLSKENDAEVEREFQLEEFNEILKEYLKQKYTFDLTTQTYTWTSDSENDKGKISTDTKTYELKKIEPNSYIMRKGQHTPDIYFRLHFSSGSWPNKERLKIQLDKNSPIEIVTDLTEIPFYKWSEHSIYHGGNFDKKKTFPRKSWYTEYTVADYPTHEKLKELKNLIIEIEKSLKEEDDKKD